MTKEEKATLFVEKNEDAIKIRMVNHADYYSSWDAKKDMKDDYLAGYEAAESEQDHLMCKFAEWMHHNGYMQYKDETWTCDFGIKEKFTTQQLLNKFKDSLKK